KIRGEIKKVLSWLPLKSKQFGNVLICIYSWSKFLVQCGKRWLYLTKIRSRIIGKGIGTEEDSRGAL
ncbi:MAG: hypothetical protein ACQESA_03345, partial [Patescibacteria group bacterium]